VTYLVAFDGGDRSRAALARAESLADRTGERLVAVSVVPTDEALAAAYDLVADGDYDPEAAADRLRAAAADVAPAAAFHAERVDAYAGKRRIAERIQRVARAESADVIVLGGDDAGRVVGPLASDDALVEDPPDYDLLLVRSG